VAAAGVGQAHGVLAGLLQQGQAAADGAQGRGVGDAEQVAEDFLRRVVAQPEEGEQELVVGWQVEVIASAEGALAVGAVEASSSAVGEGGEE